MGKQIRFDSAARAALRRGLDRLADTVRVTLGPTGRNIVLEMRHGAPTVTNDGMTVAREISLPDPVENLGVHLAREVSGKTQEAAGDGTTTAVVLAQVLVGRGLDAVESGANPVALKRGMERAQEQVVLGLRNMSRPLGTGGEVARVAALAAGQDAALGDLVARAMQRAGPGGLITVAEGRGVEDQLDFVDGVRIPAGFTSVYFVNEPDTMRAELRNCRVLVCDGALTSGAEIAPALSLAAGLRRPLLIVAREIGEEALGTLVANHVRGHVQVCGVQAPGFGDRQREQFQDLAALSGACVISRELGRGVDTVVESDLGEVRRAVVDRETTTLLGGQGSRHDVEALLRSLEQELKDSTGGPGRERIAARLARLRGAAVVIHAGGESPQAIEERCARVEDALAATRAALEEGVVPGGGVALLRAASAVELGPLGVEEAAGARILLAALEAPLRRIAENSGVDAAETLERVRGLAGPMGFNALTREIQDLDRAGILDPLKVVRIGLQNAVSISTLILTTDCLITEDPKPPPSP